MTSMHKQDKFSGKYIKFFLENFCFTSLCNVLRALCEDGEKGTHVHKIIFFFFLLLQKFALLGQKEKKGNARREGEM